MVPLDDVILSGKRFNFLMQLHLVKGSHATES